MRTKAVLLPQAIDYADKWFSLWIRSRDGRCMTCGEPGGDLQCGHYISRSVYTLRWNECNAAAQCPICNQIHEENPVPLGLVISDMWGEKILDRLRQIQFGPSEVDPIKIMALGAIYRERYMERNR